MKALLRFAVFFLCVCTLTGCTQNELPAYLTGNRNAIRYRDIPWYITSEELIDREKLSADTFDYFPYTGSLPENIVRKEPIPIEGLPLSAYVSYRFLSEGQSEVTGLHEIVLVFLSEDEATCIETRNLILERLQKLAPPLSKPGQELSFEEAKNTPVTEEIGCQADDLSAISVAVYPPDVTSREGQYGTYLTIRAGLSTSTGTQN